MTPALVHQVLSAPERQSTQPLNPIPSHQCRSATILPCIRQPSMSPFKFTSHFQFAIEQKETKFGNSEKAFLRSDNGSDHRAGTIDLIIEKHTQVRLRVHRIVIMRLPF
jgi:hypothetical protein